MDPVQVHSAIVTLINQIDRLINQPDIICNREIDLIVGFSKYDTSRAILFENKIDDVIFKVINANKTHKEILKKCLIIIENLYRVRNSILTSERLDIIQEIVSFVGVNMTTGEFINDESNNNHDPQ
jgi:hypothetical protein